MKKTMRKSLAAILSLTLLGVSAPRPWSCVSGDNGDGYQPPVTTTTLNGYNGYCPYCEEHFAGQSHYHGVDDSYPSSDQWCTDILEYTVGDDGVRITGLKVSADKQDIYPITTGFSVYNPVSLYKDLIIPASIDNVPVTAINEGVFSSAIANSVTIPKSVLYIGDEALGYAKQYPIENAEELASPRGTSYSTSVLRQINGFTIYGYGGTAAEEYANSDAHETPFNFVDLEKSKEEVTEQTVLTTYTETELTDPTSVTTYTAVTTSPESSKELPVLTTTTGLGGICPCCQEHFYGTPHYHDGSVYNPDEEEKFIAPATSENSLKCRACGQSFNGRPHVHGGLLCTADDIENTYPSTEKCPAEIFDYVIDNGKVKICGFKSGAVYPQDIVIPETIEGLPVTTIEDEAFFGYGYGVIRSFTVPKSVTYIGDMAFGYADEQRPEEFYDSIPLEKSTNYCMGVTAILEGFVICGYGGTEAEEYSKDVTYGRTFTFIDLETLDNDRVLIAEKVILTYGDLNSDSNVTGADVITFINHFLGANLLTDSAYKNADVTDDGEVDVRDLATLKQFVMGDKVSGRLKR